MLEAHCYPFQSLSADLVSGVKSTSLCALLEVAFHRDIRNYASRQCSDVWTQADCDNTRTSIARLEWSPHTPAGLRPQLKLNVDQHEQTAQNHEASPSPLVDPCQCWHTRSYPLLCT